MTDLDELSAEQLHDMAVRRARRHLDVKFFWDLIKVVPAAEAAAGDFGDAMEDVQTLHAHVDDLTDAGRGDVAEQLKPFYIDYLRRHGVTAES
jgi:hypothetical protein